jgi:hypothetical protein
MIVPPSLWGKQKMNMNKKTIFIRRREPSTRLAREIAQDTVMKIGGGLTGTGTPLKGINFVEERKYLPSIVGIPVDHTEFTSRVDKWYNTMSINIPFQGLKLELEFDDEGEPGNVRDFLFWKFLLSHPKVAADKTSMLSNPNYKCYIEDEQVTSTNESKILDVKRKAYIEFSKIVDDEVRMDVVMRQLAILNQETAAKYIKMDFKDKQVALSKFMEKDYEKFLKVATEENADLKAEIYTMIEFGVLTQAGSRIIYKTTPLGESMDETIAYLKAPVNNETYAILKGTLSGLGGALKRKEVPKPAVKETK